MNHYYLSDKPDPTRAAGLKQLEAFAAQAQDYTKTRNLVTPDKLNVSRLSPYLRHRLLSEQEVIKCVLDQHEACTVQKFIDEVTWRTYWKGWLEQRPNHWSRYQTELKQASADYSLVAYQQAITANTSIDCFNQWVNELVHTGYLHNHVRLWFASIWVFTLKLPWVLGAEWFYRHLLDGDAASNTLSWRWVAGLHTRGKHYLATANNIRQCSQGLYSPSSRELNESAEALSDDWSTELSPLSDVTSINPALATGLLLTEDDLSPEQSLDASINVCSISVLALEAATSDYVLTFKEGAINDGVQRAQAHWSCPSDNSRIQAKAHDIHSWIEANGLDQVIMMEPPCGPSRDAIAPFVTNGTIKIVRRAWDEQLWPYAQKGFFNFKKRTASPLVKLCH